MSILLQRSKTAVLLLCLGLLNNGLKAQDLNYVKTLVDTLASEDYHGRGYVNNGATKAARLIANQFKEIGLKPYKGDSYYQKFGQSVNTFPGTMMVKLQDKMLVAGQDYLVKPWSDGCSKQKLNLVYLEKKHVKSLKKFNKLMVKNTMSQSAIVVHYSLFNHITEQEIGAALRENPMKAAAIIYIVEKKLTWSVANKAENFVALEILESAFNKNARTIELDIEQKFINKFSNQNVIGYLPGTKYPDSFIVVSAHYDHLGRMGTDACFYGTNDNASGTAMMLDLAKNLALESLLEKPLPYSLVFIAFGAEEAGLVGSKYFTENPYFPLENISLLINLDLVSTGEDGIMVVNGAVFKNVFARIESINTANNYMAKVKKRGKAANSDHYWFSEAGVPSIFIYLLGEYPHYHDIYDTPDKPNWAGYDGFFKLIKDLIKTKGD